MWLRVSSLNAALIILWFLWSSFQVSRRISFCFIIPDIQYYICCKHVYKNGILLRFYSREDLCTSLDAGVNHHQQHLWFMGRSVVWFHDILFYVTCTLLNVQYFSSQYEGWNSNFGNTPLDWIQQLLE